MALEILTDSADYTLPDDAWKDSFDKLLSPRPLLRGMNVLKRTNEIRASFNLNSSIENSVENSKNDSCGLFAKQAHFIVSPNLTTTARTITTAEDRNASDCNTRLISTPVGDRLTVNPFKCSISPIGAWKFRFFGKDKAASLPKLQPNPVQQPTKKVSIPKANKPANGKKSSINPGRKTTRSSANAVKRVCFFEEEVQTDEPTIQIVVTSEPDRIEPTEQRPSNIPLQPGKWRKSLRDWRRTCNGNGGNRNSSNQVISIIDESTDIKPLQPVAINRKSIKLSDITRPDRTSAGVESIYSHKNNGSRLVLERCKQRKPIQFRRAFKAAQLDRCRKIGEGVYGEVFKYSASEVGETDAVVKIIPIEGDLAVNGEQQKTFEQILPEIIITMELSKLQHEANNAWCITPGFIAIKKASCVQGKYPARLIQLWDEYDEEKESENDRPDIFPETQLYIILELANGGQDLEAFQFNNAEQSYAALQQIILTLAVGEEAFQFEHRDLHWGNILLLATADNQLTFKLNNKKLTIPTQGVKVTIIDYTLSRMTFSNCCLYNNLANDEELFSATGDYQFEIYRMMRDALGNNWERYEPKTNVFWLSYVIEKLLKGVAYKNTRSKTHKTHMCKLQDLQKNILNFASAVDVAEYVQKF